MSTTNQRRQKRERERLKQKIHKQFVEKIKGMNNDQVLIELEKIRQRYGLEWKQQDGTINTD